MRLFRCTHFLLLQDKSLFTYTNINFQNSVHIRDDVIADVSAALSRLSLAGSLPLTASLSLADRQCFTAH